METCSKPEPEGEKSNISYGIIVSKGLEVDLLVVRYHCDLCLLK